MLRVLKSLTVLIMSQSLIFTSLAYADQLALPTGDIIAPQISHEALTESIVAGSSQKIKAIVTDNVGIQSVILFYRTIGIDNYQRVQMNQVEESNDYVATLGFNVTVEPGIEYYIQAVDMAGNVLLSGYSFSPLTIAVTSVESATVPAQAPTLSAEQSTKEEQLGKKKTNKWLWIGLGVLAVGVIAAVAGGGDEDTPTTTGKTGSLTITAPTP